MEVILLENVGNLGSLGDKVDVKAGYGRNFLIPHGKAVPATGDNVAKFEARRADLDERRQGPQRAHRAPPERRLLEGAELLARR